MTELALTIYSDSLGKSVPIRVLYPQQHYLLGVPERPYRVLYLLHGLGDDETFWLRRTGIESCADGKHLIVVMPDGDVSWYCDMDRGRKYFTYITEELPKQIRTLFQGVSDKREDTFIGGASMGGYGAFKAAMTYPKRYSKAFSFSGALDIPALEPWIEKSILENAMGPLEEAVRGEASLYVAAERVRASGHVLPQFYMWCGYDDFLYQANLKFRGFMQEKGLPLTYREGEGAHRWQDWDRELERALEFLL